MDPNEELKSIRYEAERSKDDLPRQCYCGKYPHAEDCPLWSRFYTAAEYAALGKQSLGFCGNSLSAHHDFRFLCGRARHATMARKR